MPKHGKIYFWLKITIALVAIIVLAALSFQLSGLFNPAAVKSKIIASISSGIGCAAEYQSLEVSFFPRPRAVVREGSICYGGQATARVKSLTVFPRMLPLLRGKLQIARANLEEPDVTVQIPNTPPASDTEQDPTAAPPSLAEIKSKTLELLALLASGDSPLAVEIRNGTLQLSRGEEPVFSIEAISGEIHVGPEKLGMDLTSKSNLWERFALKGWIDPVKFESSGIITLAGFQPQVLTNYLFPNSFRQLGVSRLDVQTTFSGEGPGIFKANFQGSLPALCVVQGSENCILRGESIQGDIDFTPAGLTVSLAKLEMQEPQISLSGNLHLDSDPRRMKLHLEGKDTDAASVRKASLFLGGENVTVQDVFEIIKGGRVPHITLDAEAGSLARLFKPRNMVIRGNIVDGNVYIKKPDLNINQVIGDVVIARGILTGTDLHGVTGNSIGDNGYLRVALRHGDAPFHLDIDVNADLFDLPPVLFRVVKNQGFLKELSIAKNIQGKALGKLILGESLDHVDTEVQVKEFTLSGQYQRLPHPLDLKGDALVFKEDMISVDSLAGKMGKSSFSDLSLSYTWGAAPHIKVALARQAEISLDEFYPWLVTHDKPKETLHRFASVKGILWLDSFDLAGPLFTPKDWSFKSSGRVENFSLDSTLFPGPTKVKSGKFEATKDILSMTDFRTESSDAAVTLSSTLKGYFDGPKAADLVLKGNIGPQTNQWLCDLIHLPREYRIKTPFTVSQSHLAWDKGGKSTFTADLGPQNGPRAKIDVLDSSGRVTINRLDIKDQDSDASFSIALGEKGFDFSMDGVLRGATMDRLMADNQLLDGTIKGKFACHILDDQPMNSTVKGNLEVQKFQRFWKIRPGVTIDSASIEADGNRLNILSSSLDWEDSRLVLRGTIDYSPEQYKLDLDLISDNLDYEDLKKAEGDKAGEKEGEGGPSLAHGLSYDGIPLRGAVRVKTDLFTYGKLTWSPLAANILLHGEGVNIELEDSSNLCGIATPGKVELSAKGMRLNIKPVAKAADLDTALVCLWNKHGLMNGTFDLTGEITGEGANDNLVKSLHGNLELNAQKGRMYRFEFLKKIFAMLNVTEIYRGQLPDLLTEGCAYDSIKAKGKFENGQFTFSESVLDGPCARMVWKGRLDLVNNKTNVTVLVSPLKTVDTIVKHVPLIGGILGGALISIPVEISGNTFDPDVIPLSPVAVGSELLGYMKRTFQIPFSLIQPLL